MKQITKTFRLFLYLLIAANLGQLNAQSKLNFGLSVKQPESELPQSKAEFIEPVKKIYQYFPAELLRDGEGDYTLHRGWEMTEASKLFGNTNSLWNTTSSHTVWYNATVPGTVLTTLVDQGVYPDPYYSLNNLHIPDTLCRMDWWYRIAFDMPEDSSGSDYELLLNGINYKADVWFNGKQLGNIHGAFKRGLFPLNGLWKKDGKNILAIHVFPPNNPGIPHEENIKSFGPNGGGLCLDGPTFISSEGWDWIPGIRDRNIGIWQDVKLVKTDKVKIVDPFIITDLPLPDTTYVDLTIKTTLVNVSDQPQDFLLKGTMDKVNFIRQVTLRAHERKEIVIDRNEFNQLRIKHPKLWWPNGYGQQPLYNFQLSIEQRSKVLQTKNIRFGIREFSYELMAQSASKENIRVNYQPTDCQVYRKPLFNYKTPVKLDGTPYAGVYIPILEEGAEAHINRATEDTENPYLTILINGQKIFCRGGNWGMDDGMKRVSREVLEPCFKLHKESGFTMVRNWTGESTEEVFYSLCDEYGLLVWNDFMMSTQGYNLEPLDYNLFLDNIQDVVRRFRNHPSIAIWAPRNEGYAPAGLEDGLQEVIHTQDGTRHYHGNTRLMNLCPSGPWAYQTNSLEFLTKRADGFTTELGSPAVPTAQTIRKFIPEEDLWPIGDVWYYHDVHIQSFEWKKYIEDVNRIGKSESRGVNEFATRAQFINFNLYRNMFETWNSKMWGHASGMLLWMSHPAWPSMIWQTYSYDYETPGSYFGSKKACEPIHIQWNGITHKVQAINTTLDSLVNARATFTVYDAKGKKLSEKNAKVHVKSNRTTDCFEASLPTGRNELSLVRVKLKNASGKLLSINDYWINPADGNDFSLFGDMKDSKLSISEGEKYTQNNVVYMKASVKNTGKDIALGVKLNVRDGKTNKIILPAFLSDGYFNLLPDEVRQIEVEFPTTVNQKTYLSAENLNDSSR